MSFRGTQTFRDLVIPQRFYLPMPPHWGLEFQRMDFRGTEILRPQQTADRHGILTNRSECVPINLGFPGGSDHKESACNVGDLGSVPGSGRSSGGGRGNPLQYSNLENPADRGAWRATVHAVAKNQI